MREVRQERGNVNRAAKGSFSVLLAIPACVFKPPIKHVTTSPPFGLPSPHHRLPEKSTMLSSTVLVLLLSPLVWLVYRIIEWQQRLALVRKTMPAYGLWIEPYSLLRRLVPTRWQTFFPDWQFQQRRKFDSLGTNIIPIVSLFGKDSFYISDPEAVVEIYSNQTRFPKDLKLYSTFPAVFVGLRD